MPSFNKNPNRPDEKDAKKYDYGADLRPEVEALETLPEDAAKEWPVTKVEQIEVPQQFEGLRDAKEGRVGTKSAPEQLVDNTAARLRLNEAGLTQYLTGSGHVAAGEELRLEVPQEKRLKVSAALVSRNIAFNYNGQGVFVFTL